MVGGGDAYDNLPAARGLRARINGVFVVAQTISRKEHQHVVHFLASRTKRIRTGQAPTHVFFTAPTSDLPAPTGGAGKSLASVADRSDTLADSIPGTPRAAILTAWAGEGSAWRRDLTGRFVFQHGRD